MKTKSLITVAALLSALSVGPAFEAKAQVPQPAAETNVSATSTPLLVLQTKPMQFRVSYTNPKTPKLLIRIIDADEQVLFSESRTVSKNYLRYFDLSPLLDGTYTFEITDGNEKYSQSFDIMTQTHRIVATKN